MMEFQDIASGVTMYVDPLAIQAVVPAIAPPAPGVRPDQHIPRVIGAQLIIAGVAPIAVRGLPVAVADDVAKGKAELRRATVTLMETGSDE